MRRTIFAALVVLMPSMPLISAAALLFTTVAMLTYYLVVKPYQETTMNKMAVANEIFLALFTVILVTTSMVDERDIMLGWGIIALVLLIVHSNVMFILGQAYLHIQTLCNRKQQPTGVTASKQDVELDDMPSPKAKKNLEHASEQAEELPAAEEVAAPTLQLRQRPSEPQSSGSSSADEGSSSPTTRSASEE